VTTFGIDPADILHVSAKSGVGVKQVLEAIIQRIPPPSADDSAPLRALLFDSLYVSSVYTGFLSDNAFNLHSYDRFRGVISLLSIQGGVLKKGKRRIM
jgi:translation factor GUF1, mitochondrial